MVCNSRSGTGTSVDSPAAPRSTKSSSLLRTDSPKTQRRMRTEPKSGVGEYRPAAHGGFASRHERSDSAARRMCYLHLYRTLSRAPRLSVGRHDVSPRVPAPAAAWRFDQYWGSRYKVAAGILCGGEGRGVLQLR